MRLCKCGCGQEVSQTNKYYVKNFIDGHYKRSDHLKKKMIQNSVYTRYLKTGNIFCELKKCKCGCNNYTKNDSNYINGHFSRGQVKTEEHRKNLSKSLKEKPAWNKGKINIYSEESLEKMRKSKLGKKLSKEHTERIKSSVILRWNNSQYKAKMKLIYSKRDQKGKNNPNWKEWNELKQSTRDGYLHKIAWNLRGKSFCENCGMSNEDHKKLWGSRLEMHNTLDPKDYRIMSRHIWMTLCKECHAGLERALENEKIFYKVSK